MRGSVPADRHRDWPLCFGNCDPPDGSISTTAPVTFTPKYWGDFYTLASVADTSLPAQTDRQVIKVTILPRPPVLTYTGFPTTLTYNTGINLRPLFLATRRTARAFPFAAHRLQRERVMQGGAAERR